MRHRATVSSAAGVRPNTYACRMELATVLAFPVSGAVDVGVVGVLLEASSAKRECLCKRAFGGLGLLILIITRALSSLKVRNGWKGGRDSSGWRNRESKQKGPDAGVGPCLDEAAFDLQELLLGLGLRYIDLDPVLLELFDLIIEGAEAHDICCESRVFKLPECCVY